METETFFLVCFESTQKAIYTEKQIKRQTDGARLVPIPPEIRTGCGLGLRIAPEIFDSVKNTVVNETVYIVRKEGNQRNITRWEEN